MGTGVYYGTYQSISCAVWTDISVHDVLIVRLFPLSLFGSAFAWFTSLPPNSISGWTNMEKRFPKYFYTRFNELKLTDPTLV
jgi:hypothetical protein